MTIDEAIATLDGIDREHTPPCEIYLLESNFEDMCGKQSVARIAFTCTCGWHNKIFICQECLNDFKADAIMCLKCNGDFANWYYI